MTTQDRDFGRILDVGEAVDRAMRRGAERAIRRHRRLDIPLLWSEGGELVEVDPWSVKRPMVDITLLPAPEDAYRCEELIRALELYDHLSEDWGRAG